jgi:hypothetical protein
MRLRFSVTVILILMAAASPATAQQPLDLRLNLKAGTSYSCQMETEQQIAQTVNDEDRKLGQETLQSWRYDVIGVNDHDDFKLRLTYTRIRVRQDYGFQLSEYDSDSPPDYVEPFMRGYAALVGSELLITITPKGKITDIDGADSLFESIIAELDLPDSPRKDEIMDGIRGQFGETAIRQSIEQIFSFFPQSPVETGQMWTSEKEITSGIPMKVVDEYTLKSSEDGVAYIDVFSRVSSHPDRRPVQLGPVEMVYEIQGSHRGYVRVDEPTGLPLESQLDMDLSGTIRASGVPDEDQEAWPMRSTGRVSVTFQRIPD